jgi:hypothetical protein
MSMPRAGREGGLKLDHAADRHRAVHPAVWAGDGDLGVDLDRRA